MRTTDITFLVPAKTAVPTPQRMATRGTVTIPPADLTDETVTVTLPSYSADYGWPCRWVRQGTTLPAIRAECLVLWDETGAGTVVQWAGAGTGAAGLDERLDTLEAEVKGQVIVTGTGITLAEAVVTDNLGTTAKYGLATQYLGGGTFNADACVGQIVSVTANTTTIRALTRLGGNITTGQTVALNYRIWR